MKDVLGDNDLSINICSFIIPAIYHLQNALPQHTFASVLGLELIMQWVESLQLDVSFLCTDLKESDSFFNNLKKKCIY